VVDPAGFEPTTDAV